MYSERELKLFDKAHMFYNDGEYKKAFKLYNELADLGSTSSQRFLAWMYYLGEGVDSDINLAEHWMKKAAEENDAEALFGLGKINAKNGEYENALHYFREANNFDFAPATYCLGMYYLLGIGTEKNILKACQLLKKSYKNGNLLAGKDWSKYLIGNSKNPFNTIKGIFVYIKVVITIVIVAITDTKSQRLMG